MLTNYNLYSCSVYKEMILWQQKERGAQREAKTLFKHTPKAITYVTSVKSDIKGYSQDGMGAKFSVGSRRRISA